MSRIIYLEQVDSTNNYAQQHFDLYPNRTLITANEQNGGKGRNGKSWVSPANLNLYASYIIKDIPFLSYKASWIGGLAALNTIKDVCNSNCWIKWPNDIYVEKKKIAGILCETNTNTQNQILGIIIGIGININITGCELKKIDKPATSILAETGNKYDIRLMGQLLHENLNKLYNKVLQQGIESIFDEWKYKNQLIGNSIEIALDNKSILNAKVIDIEKTGELVVIDDESNIHRIYSGDVSIKKFTYKKRDH